MMNVLKFELDRAFRNRRMLAALLIGCAVSLWHLWDYILPVQYYVSEGGYPLSSFNKWMGGGKLFFSGFRVFYVDSYTLCAASQHELCV